MATRKWRLEFPHVMLVTQGVETCAKDGVKYKPMHKSHPCWGAFRRGFPDCPPECISKRLSEENVWVRTGITLERDVTWLEGEWKEGADRTILAPLVKQLMDWQGGSGARIPDRAAPGN